MIWEDDEVYLDLKIEPGNPWCRMTSFETLSSELCAALQPLDRFALIGDDLRLPH